MFCMAIEQRILHVVEPHVLTLHIMGKSDKDLVFLKFLLSRENFVWLCPFELGLGSCSFVLLSMNLGTTVIVSL